MLLFDPHFGVFEEEDLFAERIELDYGFEVRDAALEGFDGAFAEAVVLHPLAGAECGHR